MRALGYLVAWVEPDGTVSGLFTNTVVTYRDACEALRNGRSLYMKGAAKGLQVVRVSGEAMVKRGGSR